MKIAGSKDIGCWKYDYKYSKSFFKSWSQKLIYIFFEEYKRKINAQNYIRWLNVWRKCPSRLHSVTANRLDTQKIWQSGHHVKWSIFKHLQNTFMKMFDFSNLLLFIRNFFNHICTENFVIIFFKGEELKKGSVVAHLLGNTPMFLIIFTWP